MHKINQTHLWGSNIKFSFKVASNKIDIDDSFNKQALEFLNKRVS